VYIFQECYYTSVRFSGLSLWPSYRVVRNPWPGATASCQRLARCCTAFASRQQPGPGGRQPTLLTTTTSAPEKDNGMTSSVPLQTYRSQSQYSDFDSPPAPARNSTLSYAEGEYDPYYDSQAKPWSNTAFAESTTDSDGMHKPSLSYGSKGPSK
jgi:hypothetical protein